MDIEGVPPYVWSRTTFEKIAKLWGDLIYFEDSNGGNLYSVRLCVKTKMQDIILDSFKVEWRANTVVVRAKEVTGWIPDFITEESNNDHEKEDFVDGIGENEDEPDENETDEHVSETDLNSLGGNGVDITDESDPFNLVDLINRTSRDTPEFPPGFSPQEKVPSRTEGQSQGVEFNSPPEGMLASGSSSTVAPTHNSTLRRVRSVSPVGVRVSGGRSGYSGDVDDHVSTVRRVADFAGEINSGKVDVHIDGFSIVDRISQLVDVGRAMGYEMSGCEKNLDAILNSFGDKFHAA